MKALWLAIGFQVPISPCPRNLAFPFSGLAQHYSLTSSICLMFYNVSYPVYMLTYIFLVPHCETILTEALLPNRFPLHIHVHWFSVTSVAKNIDYENFTSNKLSADRCISLYLASPSTHLIIHLIVSISLLHIGTKLDVMILL